MFFKNSPAFYEVKLGLPPLCWTSKILIYCYKHILIYIHSLYQFLRNVLPWSIEYIFLKVVIYLIVYKIWHKTNMTLFYWSYWTKTILIRKHSLKNKFNEVKYWPKFHILNIWTLYKLRLQLNCNEIFYIHIQIFRFLKLQKAGAFPDSSVGKESVCNAGDPSMISGSGRSTGEGKSYPLQYSGLENPMDYAIQSMGSQTVRHDWATHFQTA